MTMDRRRFLGLLGAGAAAALYAPKRSYFFGPCLPGTPTQQEPGTIRPVWRDGKLVQVIERWSPERVRWSLDQVEGRTLSGAELLDAWDYSGYEIREIAEDHVVISADGLPSYVWFAGPSVLAVISELETSVGAKSPGVRGVVD